MKATVFSLLFFIGYIPGKAHALVPTRIYETTTVVSGKTVYIAATENPADHSRKLPVLLALHGSGREALSYKSGEAVSVPFYVHQRDLALACGYLFVSISNGTDTWGRDEGMNALVALYQYLLKTYQIDTKWVLWGSSAGGVLANRMVMEHPNKVKKVIGTFPVYDLVAAYQHLPSAGKAWKTVDEVMLVNPARNPRALIHVPYLIFHGRKDEAVPAGPHSERLKNEVNGAGGQVSLHLVDGGHSTTNFALYDDGIIKAFLSK
jgi:predicted esterase